MKDKHSVVSIILYLSVFIMLFSCQTKKTEWMGTIEEEDGVILVKNPNEPIYDEDVFSLNEELSIGVAEGREEFMFAQLSDFDVDDEERIYVLESKESKIRVFDNKGNYLQTIGKKGQGPGEFQYPHFIQILDNQEMIIWDPQTRCFLIFSLAGEYLRKISTSRVASLQNPVKWDKKGNLIAFLIPPPPIGDPELVKLNGKLERLMTIAKKDKSNSYRTRKFKVKEPWLYCAVFKDGSVIWGDSKKYELHVLNPEGKLVRKIIRFCKPVKITDREKEDLEERYSHTSVAKLGYEPIFPKHYPFFHDISVDEEGRIFVLTYEKPRKEKNFYYLDIFDSEGRYIGKVPIRTRLSSFFWKKKKLYTIEKDEGGYPVVKRYKVTWSI